MLGKELGEGVLFVVVVLQGGVVPFDVVIGIGAAVARQVTEKNGVGVVGDAVALGQVVGIVLGRDLLGADRALHAAGPPARASGMAQRQRCWTSATSRSTRPSTIRR